jgi:hypothetical protein
VALVEHTGLDLQTIAALVFSAKYQSRVLPQAALNMMILEDKLQSEF